MKFGCPYGRDQPEIEPEFIRFNGVGCCEHTRNSDVRLAWPAKGERRDRSPLWTELEHQPRRQLDLACGVVPCTHDPAEVRIAQAAAWAVELWRV